jgi:lauroyl/myristoyl acyltransferase
VRVYWQRDLWTLWNARPLDCPRFAWAILIALRPLPWPWAERLLEASFRVRALVEIRDLRRALAWAGAQPGVTNRWRLAVALSAYEGRFVARNSLLGIRTPEILRRFTTVRGAEHLAGAVRGVILLGFQAGPRLSWLALRAAGHRLTWLGGRPSPLWSPHIRKRYLDGQGDLILSTGAVESMRLLRRAQRILRDGGAVFMNADGAGTGAFSVPLPGRPIVIQEGWLALRRLTGATVLPVLSHLEGPTQVVAIHPPLPAPTDDPAVDLENCRRALGDLLIDYTARHPEQCALFAFARRSDARVPDRTPRKKHISRPAMMGSDA